MAVIEALTDEECYLFAIISDESGVDLAEFTFVDNEQEDGCFRCWPFQYSWYRDNYPLQVNACGRAVGKSNSIRLRAFAFPFNHPGQEMVITGPEGVHVDAITDLIETQFYSTRIGREMLVGGRFGVKHRPFHMNFANGARIMGRIPQSTGRGLKGCVAEGTPILTDKGFVYVQDLQVGDMVLTHRGRWRPVLSIQEDVNDVVEARGQGSVPLTVSCDHRFYGVSNLATSKEKRRFTDSYFSDVNHLVDDKFYWATPRAFPPMSVPVTTSWVDGPRLPVDREEFWWLAGRWVADGHRSMDKKNNKGRKVCWSVHPKDQKDIIEKIESLGWHYRINRRDSSTADILTVSSSQLYRYFGENFGEHASGKKVPVWLLGSGSWIRSAFLEGYLSGDGHWVESRNRWQVGTASRFLALGIQFLAQSLGYTVNCSKLIVKPNALCDNPLPSWTLQIGHGNPSVIGDHLVAKVRSVASVGKAKVYNPIVEDDHSYISGSIVSHNVHPIALEIDEAQDLPPAAWVEVTSTLKRGVDGAIWRASGVTRGVRDKFHEYSDTSNPDNKWKVWHFVQMHRPNWTDEERQMNIQMFNNSKDDPDYRRNVLGLPGDATSPVFVASRLFRCVDDDVMSEYNQEEYYKVRISDQQVGDEDILEFLSLPRRHIDDYKKGNKWPRFWVGQDCGFTRDPSEILVFVEHVPEQKWDKDKQEWIPVPKTQRKAQLKLLTRITLVRIKTQDQAKVIQAVIDFYKPQAYSMDKGGNGLPLFHLVQEANLDSATVIKGYNHSEKVVVELDETVEKDPYTGDIVTDAFIKRNVLEVATDKLRELVDGSRIYFPWDKNLIAQFQGATEAARQKGQDAYGRNRTFSSGEDHALDAARQAVMGYGQETIEEILKEEKFTPVQDVFMEAW